MLAHVFVVRIEQKPVLEIRGRFEPLLHANVQLHILRAERITNPIDGGLGYRVQLDAIRGVRGDLFPVRSGLSGAIKKLQIPFTCG